MPDKVAARILTAGEVVAAASRRMSRLPWVSSMSGRPEPQRLPAECQTLTSRPDDLANIVVADDADGRVVTRIRDVGRVELGARTTAPTALGRSRPWRY